MVIKLGKAHKLSRRFYFRGLHISIETDKGELRHWYDPHNKTKGTTKMKYPYGYIRRTKGTDGDHVDVYVGPNEQAKNVYIIHQMKAPDFKKFDEDKCMLGFNSAESARAAYHRHYNDKRFLGTITTMPFEEFEKKVLRTFDLKRPPKIAEALVNTQTKLAYTLGVDAALAVFEKRSEEAPVTPEDARATLVHRAGVGGGGLVGATGGLTGALAGGLRTGGGFVGQRVGRGKGALLGALLGGVLGGGAGYATGRYGAGDAFDTDPEFKQHIMDLLQAQRAEQAKEGMDVDAALAVFEKRSEEAPVTPEDARAAARTYFTDRTGPIGAGLYGTAGALGGGLLGMAGGRKGALLGALLGGLSGGGLGYRAGQSDGVRLFNKHNPMPTQAKEGMDSGVLNGLLNMAESAGGTIRDYAQKGYNKAEEGTGAALDAIGLGKPKKKKPGDQKEIVKEALGIKAILAGAGLLGGGGALAAGALGDKKKSVADAATGGVSGSRTQRGLEAAGIGGY